MLACVVCLNEAVKRERETSGPKFHFAAITEPGLAEIDYDKRKRTWKIPPAFTVSEGEAVCMPHLYSKVYTVTDIRPVR